MFQLHPGAWVIGREDPEEARQRMHRVAIHEVRSATEYRASKAQQAPASPARTIAGLRFAPTSASSGDLAACCV